jgi:glycosyltransferase involved in cell wall biosynthesis
MPVKSSLTVIILCYSHKDFFNETFQSVIQNAKSESFQVTIFDNGCSEEYRKIIANSIKGHNVNIVRLEQNTYGLGFRIHLLNHIDTEYFSLIHDDDVYVSDKIKKSLAAIKEEGGDFLVTNVRYIDAKGGAIVGDLGEETNAKPFSSEDLPGTFLSDMFISPGSRLHISTLVIKTRLAQSVNLGDPFYPRISECFFWAYLLLDPKIKMTVIEEPLTDVRIHGANDRLYSKFSPWRRAREFRLLETSEIILFEKIVCSAKENVLIDFARRFIDKSNRNKDLIETLVLASIAISAPGHTVSCQRRGAILFHKAFELNSVKASEIILKETGFDATQYMNNLYNRAFMLEIILPFRNTYPRLVRFAKVFLPGIWGLLKRALSA